MKSQGEAIYLFGDFSLDSGRSSLSKGSSGIPLRRKTYETLLYLVQNRNRVVSKEELLDSLWSGIYVNEGVVSQCIGEIRSALDDEKSRSIFIKTFPKTGYQFVAEVKKRQANPAPPSIAILPFRDMSSKQDQEYFCDGLTEEVINSLTRLKGLHVIARTSSFAFKGKDIDIREIGRQLNVGFVLEGSLRREESRLRVAVQLINVTNGFHIWSEEIDRELGDIFSIQEQIASTVVSHLQVELLEGEDNLSPKRSPESFEAFNLYLRGRFLLYRECLPDYRDAIRYFEQAIEIDKEYAAPYASIAKSYIGLTFWSIGQPSESRIRKTKDAVLRSLEIDSESSLAHEALTLTRLVHDWDWKGADKSSRRALQLSPGSESAHTTRALYLVTVGNMATAIAEGEIAISLDPLSNIARSWHGGWLLRANLIHDAISQLQKALELEPINPRAHWYLGTAYILNQRFPEGIAEIKKAIDMFEDNPNILAGLGWAYGKSGRIKKAEQILIDLEIKANFVWPYLFAKVNVGLKRIDEAFLWLDRAFEQHDTVLPFIKTDETMTDLHSDPRLVELLRKMKLDDESLALIK